MIIRDQAELEQENAQVLHLVQAMIGRITPNMRAVSLECGPNGVSLSFLIDREEPSDREEIEDLAFEFETLQSRGIKLDVSVIVSSKESAIDQLPGRHVYGRKE